MEAPRAGTRRQATLRLKQWAQPRLAAPAAEKPEG